MPIRLAPLMSLLIMVLTTGSGGEIVTKTVEYTHDGDALAGYLAYDDAVEGPRPGVLVIHEWWGLNDYAKRRARMLAGLGHVAFCADMYGEGKVTADPKQAGQWSGHLKGDVARWRQRALAGLKVLTDQPQTDGRRLAAIGYCFGGSTALELAISGAEVAGVVSFHGGLPAIPAGADIEAEVLVCHGAQDHFAKPEQIAAFKRGLTRRGAAWTFIEYADAEHSFTNPGADAHGMDGIAYNRRADEQSWRHMRALFTRLFGE